MKQLFNLKSYLTFLSRNKIYTAINVFGFSISLMFVIVIGLYVENELSMDHMHSRLDRIYTVGLDMPDQQVDGLHHLAIRSIVKQFPEIEMACGVTRGQMVIKTWKDDNVRADIQLTDSTFYRMFDFPLAEGDRRHVLDTPNSAVLSREFARKIFGDTDPMGKSFTLYRDVRLTVTGIYDTMEGSSIKPSDMVIRYDQMKYFNWASCDDATGFNNTIGCTVFLLTKPGTTLAGKGPQFDKLLKSIGFPVFIMPGMKDVHTVLSPFSEMYLSKRPTGGYQMRQGDAGFVNILLGVCIIVLLFSVLNYINLTVAQSGYRAREMAIRRLLGSQRGDIAAKLMIESFMLCLISFVIGALLAWALLPGAAGILDRRLTFAAFFSPLNLSIVVAVLLVVSIVSGTVPAVVMSRLNPLDVIRGTYRLKGKLVMNRVFMTVQHVITILLVAASITMSMQVRHLLNMPLGYETKGLMNVWLNDNDSLKAVNFIREVRRLPCVDMAALAMGSPLDRGNNNTIDYKKKTISFQVLCGDTCLMKVLGLQLERDNGINPNDGVYYNRAAMAAMGLAETDRANPFPDWVNGIGGKQICGILKDFHVGDAFDRQGPVMLKMADNLFMVWNVLIRVKGDEQEAYRQINSIFRGIYKMDINTDEPVFYDQSIRDAYKDIIRLKDIVTMFAAVAIVISVLGLLAMSTYFIQQRRREIAIRKVFGSTNRQIYFRLMRSFMSYVGIAFVIAVPLIYYLLNEWLSRYSYRISVWWWIYAVAGLFCFIISFVAVLAQTVRASNENPTNNLKTE